MMVLVVEKVPISLRGELTRWLLEPKTNVFVGRVSAIVRDKIWEMVCDKVKAGAAVLAHPTNNEQGFAIRTFGATSRTVIDLEGLTLIRI